LIRHSLSKIVLLKC